VSRLIEARAAYYGDKPREQRRRPVQVRAEDGQLGIDGYASVSGEPYAVRDFMGEYSETIERGAFAKALAERDDVRLLFNHDGVPLARTKSGTLTLAEDDRGLRVDANLDAASPLVQTVRSAMERGDLDEMSFAFSATRQEWNEDYTVRTIREVRLYDVSLVTYPANPATSVKLRSRWGDLEDALREGRALDAADLSMLSQALGWFTAVDNIVDEAQETLSAHIGVDNPDAEDDPLMMDSANKLRALKVKAAALRTRAA
jgi:HK97 family phage prohead protease